MLPDNSTRTVRGGSSEPVYITNEELPANAGAATEVTLASILASLSSSLTSLNDILADQVSRSVVCTSNSTTTPLGGGGIYTGAWCELTAYTNVSVAVTSNVASASSGCVWQWSMDGITADDTDAFSILAGAKKQFSFGITHKYGRIVYTNGASAQATFRLQTQLHTGAPKPSSHRVQDNIVDEDDAELVEAVLKLRTASNNYVSGASTNSGNFKISLEEVNGVVVPVTQVNSAGTTIIETRTQTPTATDAMNVQIGPGDVISNIPVTIDYGHHQIHEGESYSYCNLQTGGLASGSNFDIRISVPVLAATTRTPHMVFELIANGECEAYLHSGVTWTSGGTAAAASATTTAKDNRNHNSINAASTLLFVNGATALTVNSTGAVRYIWYLASAGQKTSTGDRSLNEIDLSSNTEYMLRITSRTTGLKFLIRIDWYEDLGV